MSDKHDKLVMSNDKKRKYDLDTFGETINVIIGPEKRLFQIHKELICNTSTYFRSALHGGFKEAKEQTVEMLEESVDIFKHFQYWLYTNTILMTKEKPNDIEWRVLVDLWIFGDARGIPHLQNAATDGIIDKSATLNFTPLDQVAHVYENTTEESPLRRLFVDKTHSFANFTIKDGHGAWFTATTYETFTKQFLFDLSMAYCRRVNHLQEKVEDFKAVRSRYYVSTLI